MATYVARALSPAEVENVQMIADGQALAVVPDDKLSLAIGKSGQNVRLAARLTHCKIDVKSHTVFENVSAHETYEKPLDEEDFTTSLDDMFNDDEE